MVPMIPGPFFEPGKINFRGQVAQLQQMFSALQIDQKMSVREITLGLQGTEVQA